MTDRVQLVDLENRALEDIFTNIQTRYLLRLQENEEVEQAPHIHYNIYKRILNCFLEKFARRIDALDNYHSDSGVTWEDSDDLDLPFIKALKEKFIPLANKKDLYQGLLQILIDLKGRRDGFGCTLRNMLSKRADLGKNIPSFELLNLLSTGELKSKIDDSFLDTLIEKYKKKFYVAACYEELLESLNKMIQGASSEKSHYTFIDVLRGILETRLQDISNIERLQERGEKVYSECYDKIFEFIKDWEGRELINTLELQSPRESIYFKYWSDMLDLNSKNICRVLPYLLTAYIGSIQKNSFFRRGSSAINEVFELSSDNFDPANKYRRIKQIERLSATFSLKEFKDACNPKKNTHSVAGSDCPSPHYLDRRFPYKEADFLHYVFYVWASVIMEESPDEEDITKEDVNVKNILGTIRATISLVDSYMLVLKYTNNSELDKFQELLDRKGGLITNSDMLTYLENKFAIMPFA